MPFVLLPALLALPASRLGDRFTALNQYAREDRLICDEPHAALAVRADKQGSSSFVFSSCFAHAHQAQIRAATAQTFACSEEGIDVTSFRDHEFIGVKTTCQRPTDRRILEFSERVDFLPLQQLLRPEVARFLFVAIDMPNVGRAGCGPEPLAVRHLSESVSCNYMPDLKAATLPTITFRFGYDRAGVSRIVGLLGFLLLLPVLTTLWLRRQATRVPEVEWTTVWFAYFRFLRLITRFGALVWWIAIDLLQADTFASLLLPPWVPRDSGVAMMLPWILLWTLAASSYAICLALSSPIHELRGVKRTRAEAWRRALWGVGRLLIPFSLLALMIAEMTNSPRAAVLLFVGVIASARFGARKWAQAYGVELHALSAGELRDRAFALAAKAAAKLYQLYVIPTEQLRIANAAAHVGHNIFLTDYLLKNLSKREVDAVIGHEVAHLQLKHIHRRMSVFFVAILAMAFLGVWIGPRLPSEFPSGPLTYGLILLAILFLTRRNEFSADAGSVKLTYDPEAMIASLARLARLNVMPFRWGKWEEQVSTHPSTMRRITRVARSAGIGEQRIAELLRQSAASPKDVYAIPSTAQPQGKIFSTRFKARLAWRLTGTLMLACATIPAVAALATQKAHLAGSSLWLAYPAGLAATIAVAVVLLNFLPVRGLAKLERLVREKPGGLGRRAGNGVFIGLAPHAEPRIYEGNWAWDVGFLSLTTESLCYQGEELQFALRRDQIARVALGPGPVGWLPSAGVYISWRDGEGTERTVNLRALSARSMLAMARATRALARDLDNWHRGLPSAANLILRPAAADASPDLPLQPPTVGSVTSLAPKDVARGRFLARDFLFNTLLAVGIVILLGLRVPLLDSVTSYDGTSLALSGGGAMYVLVVVGLTRAFLLAPYWLSTGKRARRGLTVPATPQGVEPGN